MAKKRSAATNDTLLFKKSVGQLKADVKLTFPDYDVKGSIYLNYLDKIKKPDFNSEILIQIPAYCEPEILRTIDSALKTAYNPDRVHFAICYQDNDMETLEKIKAYPHMQVKHLNYLEIFMEQEKHFYLVFLKIIEFMFIIQQELMKIIFMEMKSK